MDDAIEVRRRDRGRKTPFSTVTISIETLELLQKMRAETGIPAWEIVALAVTELQKRMVVVDG